MYQAHLKGKKHLRVINGRTVVSHCTICNMNITGGQEGWTIHVRSKRHRTTAASKGVSAVVDPVEGGDIAGQRFCDLCRTTVPDAAWGRHILSLRHTRAELYAKYRTALDEAEKDKNGVVIEGTLDFSVVEPTVAAVGTRCPLVVKCSLPFSKVVLLEANLTALQGKRNTKSVFSVTIIGDNRQVVSGRTIQLEILFQQSQIGRYQDRLELAFEDTQLTKRFIISRPLQAIVGNKADHEALSPKAPYIPRKRTQRHPETTVVEGVTPPSLNAIPYVGKLPRAVIPFQLASILSGNGASAQKVSHIRRVFMPATLDSDSYARHFKHLLWIEESKMETDLERYDIHDSTLTKHAPYYYLDVPGLAEKRPSVLVGDKILVQRHGADTGHWFSGGVHVVRQVEVGLRFAGSFQWTTAERYHIRFKLNRIPMQRQHQAMDTVFTQERVLFPTQQHVPSDSYPKAGAGIRVFNGLIATNRPQLQAVTSIVNQAAGAVPFVVFGPPGTGKTITIIEAIRQILHTNPRARILACAPSNSAADLIASRLQDGNMTNDQLFRFYAPSRFKNQVPDSLLAFTYIRPDGHFSVPPMARMKAFRVVVTTCVSASVLSGIGMARGHYSHIFIDEAGQSTEPEAFVSIKTMADNSTNIILSGDPKQLGPIIRSGIAQELGLEVSYLERLMARNIYDVQAGYGKTVVKLVKNFRSHSTILQFPNERFYNGDLEPCAERAVINAYIGSSYLPSKKFPVVFHPVTGKDLREASSPSFFNIDEVLQVKDYVQKLRADRRFITTDNDIGIIAPYHAQCLKIRASLRGVADGVKVGSVEEFQGQERKVIIISTVRSSKEFVEYDLRHTLGFVANPRRFNVAVTRAQALLIIVGDPNVLALDPLWRSFLNYVYLNNGWAGPPGSITWDPNVPVEEAGGYDRAVREAAQIDMNDFARRMEEMTLSGVDEEMDAGVDKPWRETE
ncbi:RNA helicase [Crucibulum laeve]|uniref:RNA helicase n=1 Tax=Crucibulum laeve TaxID=68775 RepID=A0A5C3MAD6_9AGAR|nr:RNA helicase [Crucibulum laeve]